MTTNTAPLAAPVRRRQGGPPLPAPAVAFAVLLIGSVVLAARVPRPTASAAAVLAYVQVNGALLQVAGTLAFGAAVPLAIWTATAYRRLYRLGVTAPGATIGLAGGLLAAASMALSGLLTWTLGYAHPTAPAVAGTVRTLAYATGAAGTVVPLALLVAGAAVPALILRLLPRWLAIAGLVVAAAGVLSTLTLLVPALSPTLPVGRFGAVAWMLAASVLLPYDRRAVTGGRDA